MQEGQFHQNIMKKNAEGSGAPDSISQDKSSVESKEDTGFINEIKKTIRKGFISTGALVLFTAFAGSPQDISAQTVREKINAYNEFLSKQQEQKVLEEDREKEKKIIETIDHLREKDKLVLSNAETLFDLIGRKSEEKLLEKHDTFYYANVDTIEFKNFSFIYGGEDNKDQYLQGLVYHPEINDSKNYKLSEMFIINGSFDGKVFYIEANDSIEYILAPTEVHSEYYKYYAKHDSNSFKNFTSESNKILDEINEGIKKEIDILSKKPDSQIYLKAEEYNEQKKASAKEELDRQVLNTKKILDAMGVIKKEKRQKEKKEKKDRLPFIRKDNSPQRMSGDN